MARRRTGAAVRRHNLLFLENYFLGAAASVEAASFDFFDFFAFLSFGAVVVSAFLSSAKAAVPRTKDKPRTRDASFFMMCVSPFV